MKAAKATLISLKISVTISEMAYGFQKHNGATDVLDAIDVVDAHILPFFASDASTGECARDWATNQIAMILFHFRRPGLEERSE